MSFNCILHVFETIKYINNGNIKLNRNKRIYSFYKFLTAEKITVKIFSDRLESTHGLLYFRC